MKKMIPDTITAITALLIIGIVGSFFIFPKVVFSQSGAFYDCVVKYCGGGGCYTKSDGRPSNITKCQDMLRYGDTAQKMCTSLGGLNDECSKCGETLACQGASFNVNPFGEECGESNQSSCSIPILVGKFLRAFFGLIGVIALVIFIYGGLLWMTSIGEEDRVKRGRETLIWAGLGLIAIFGSYVVVQFILDAVLRQPRPIPPATKNTSAASALVATDKACKDAGGSCEIVTGGTVVNLASGELYNCIEKIGVS